MTETDKVLTGRKNDKMQIEQELRQLQERKSYMSKSQHESRDKSRVLKELRAAKERGLIKGFYGRLGDLGSIHERYDIAISTACSQLECIVVETVTDAEQCINYLKQNDIGRASFIVLEKMKMHEP